MGGVAPGHGAVAVSHGKEKLDDGHMTEAKQGATAAYMQSWE
jgi:hypothetical protein